MIPKIIHQTWKNNIIPNHWKESPYYWKKYHPDYKYILWTDDDNRIFIKKNYPWFLHIFDNYPHNIQRADAIRYFLLYTFGGIYSDLDIYPKKSLDIFINKYNNPNSCVLIKSSQLGVVTNSFMMSTPKHPFWIKCIESMIENKDSKFYYTKHLYVMNSTGPLMINYVYKQYPDNVYFLPNKNFMPCSICSPKPCTNKDSFLVYTEGQSWNEWDSHILNFIYCKWKIILLILLCLIYILRQKY